VANFSSPTSDMIGTPGAVPGSSRRAASVTGGCLNLETEERTKTARNLHPKLPAINHKSRADWDIAITSTAI
jgi:hypothetical protein